MLVFGCAQGPSTPVPPAAQPSAPSTGANTQPQAPPSQPQATPGSSAADQLLSIMGLTQGWKVSYTINGTNMPSGSTMTQYIKGTDKIRVDSTAMGTESRSFVLSGKTYSCINQGESWICYKVDSSQSGQNSTNLQNDIQSNPSKYTVTADGSMQVAGVTAACYKVVSVDGTVRYCVSQEGIPLYIKTTGSTQGVSYESELTATSYSTSVSDSDFQLPATPQDIGSMTGGGSGSGGAGSACAYCNYLSGDQKTQCLASCSQAG